MTVKAGRLKEWIVSRGIFLLAIVPVFFTSCETDIQTVNMVGAVSSLPAESAKDVELMYSDSARIKMKMTAPQLDRYTGKDPREELPKGVVMEFYDDSMQVKTRLSANFGVRYGTEKRVEVKNDVVVVNEKNEQLNTEHLVWDEGTKMIYTKAFVRITTPDEVLWGNGLEANEDFSKYRILDPVGTISKEDL